jgi:hypothetical protein
MTEERVLALDMSTKTGWAFMTSSDKGIDLGAYGQLDPITEPEVDIQATMLIGPIWSLIKY